MQYRRQAVSTYLAGCLVGASLAGWTTAGWATSMRATMTVAVAPFVNAGETKPPDLANLTRALQEDVIEHLRSGGQVSVLNKEDVERAQQALHLPNILNPATALKLGNYLHVSGVVMGTFRQPQADEVRADALLVQVPGGQIVSRANSYGNDLMDEGAIDTMGEILAQGLTATLHSDGTISAPPGRSLTLTTNLTSDLLGAQGGRVQMQIDLQAAEAKHRGDRVPLNISLVMDRSGSMEGEKLEYTKQAARTLVNQLGGDDYFSLIIFDDHVRTLIPAGLVRNKDGVIRTIDQIVSGGSTNLGGGMVEGYAQVNRHLSKNRVNRVLLLSDGLANVGETDPERLQSRANSQSQEGITISTLGVGLDYNENLMLGLSRAGRGNYYFIEAPDTIPGIIASEAKGLMNVVAKDIHLQVQLAPGVRLADLSGYTYHAEGNSISIDVPDLYSKDHRFVILDLDIPGGAANHWRSLARVEARFDDMLFHTKNAWVQAAAAVRYTQDKMAVVRHERRDILANVAINHSARAMEEASKMLDRGQRETARRLLQAEKERLVKDYKRLNRPAVSGEVRALDKFEQILASPAAASGPEAQRAKKTIQYESNQRYQNRQR